MIQGTQTTQRLDLREAFQQFETAQNFIARDVLPGIGVPMESGILDVVTRETMAKQESHIIRANGAPAARIDLATEELDYRTQNWSLENQITDRDFRKFRTAFDAEVEGTRKLKSKVSLAEEARAAALLFDTALWVGADLFTNVSAVKAWSDITADIIGDVKRAMLNVRTNSGVLPDTLIVGFTQYMNILNNTAIIGRFKSDTVTDKEIMNALAPIFGLRKISVGEASYDSADEGQDFVGADVWNDSYAMVAKTCSKGAPLTAPCVARTPVWTEMIDPDDVSSIRQYYEDQTNSSILEHGRYQQQLVFDKYFAHLMQVKA